MLDNSCLLFLSNMWAGWKPNKVPVVIASGLGGTLQTGRSLDYLYAGDDNRKLINLLPLQWTRAGLGGDPAHQSAPGGTWQLDTVSKYPEKLWN